MHAVLSNLKCKDINIVLNLSCTDCELIDVQNSFALKIDPLTTLRISATNFLSVEKSLVAKKTPSDILSTKIFSNIYLV